MAEGFRLRARGAARARVSHFEIDSLPIRAQVSLLRFLQDHSYRSVGGRRECHGDVRIVVAASPRLNDLLDRGAFRDDLAFCLNVLMLEMPPLRQRTGDAELLADSFIEQHAREHGSSARPLHPRSRAWIAAYAWPGNVRELDNRVSRSMKASASMPARKTARRSRRRWPTPAAASAPCARTSKRCSAATRPTRRSSSASRSPRG